MFRYKDGRGLTHTLADAGALRDAVADGRVHPGTPFAGAEGDWTIARLHPAFRDVAGKPVSGAPKSLWDRRGTELLETWSGRLLLVLLTAVVGSGIRTFTRPPVDRGEHEAYVKAMTAFAAGDGNAAAALEQPPASRSLRPAWAVMLGTRDLLAHMEATRERLGMGEEPPPSWMTYEYLRHPDDFPEVPAYWSAAVVYHRTYQDSVLPLAEGFIRARAAEADAAGPALEEAVREMRSAMSNTIAVHETAIRASWTAGQIHHALVRAKDEIRINVHGELTFRNEYRAASYNRQIDQLDGLLARMDSLEAAGAARISANLAELQAGLGK